MCGEIEEDVHFDNEVLSRLLFMAARKGVKPGTGSAVPNLESGEGRARYMDALFSAGLTRAVTDAQEATEGQRVEAIAAQAVAFARLAGFLAAQLPPGADLLRATVEALTDGYGEPRRIAEAEHERHVREHGHDHDHGREHHHGHDHPHRHHHDHE